MSEGEKTKPEEIKESLLSKTDVPSDGGPKPYVPIQIFGFDGNLVALSVMNFFLNAAVSVITPFYPPLALDKGVSQFMIGFIFALNPIGSFSVSLSIGQMMGKLGKKNLMFWGLVIQSLTIISFGLVYYIDNMSAFIAVSMIARFLQGASRSAYGAATFGYVPQLWPTSVQKKIGIMETMTAIGLVLGPMIGSVLYSLAGGNEALAYQLPFYVLSGVFILCIGSIKWLPPDIKNKVQIDKVQAMDCLKNMQVFWTFMLMVGSAIANVYINPQYTDHMKLLGLDEDASGYVVSVGAFFYMVFLHLMPSISKKLDKKMILIIGTIISILAMLVMAPEKYLGFPLGGNYWYFVTIGQCINGVGSAMVILPMIPELIELIVVNEMKRRKVAQPDPKMIRACSDMGSSIFVGGYALGTFIGPFGGSLLYDSLPGSPEDNFMNETRILALSVLVILLFYMTIGKGYIGFSATMKKLNLCQKRSRTLNSESVIQQRAASKHVGAAPQRNATGKATNDVTLLHGNNEEGGSFNPSTIIDGQAVKDLNTDEIPAPVIERPRRVSADISEQSDELLSDHSPNEVLSAGEESQDESIIRTSERAAAATTGEKNTFYYD